MPYCKTKILLIGIYDTNSVTLAPHILISYAKGFNISEYFEFQAVEFSIFTNTVDQIKDEISRTKPDIIGFSAYVWNIQIILQVIQEKFNCKIILGGPQVTGIENKLFKENPNIDIIVSGEGEKTFLNLLYYFKGEKELAEIPGIATKDIANPNDEDLIELNRIPSIYKELLKKNPGISWLSFETSRGCPFNCGYCVWSSNKKMRYYSIDRVISELDIILKAPNIKEIYFCDSSLLLNQSRALAILNCIYESDSNKVIRFEFNAEHLDDALIEVMRKIPKMEYNFGLQTINPEALRIIGRKFNQDKFENNYRKFVEHKCDITIDLIYGLPGDNYVGYKKSLEYALHLKGVKRILTNPLIVLPGSRFIEI